MVRVTIVGTTSWGLTLGLMLARKGLEIKLWARTEQEANKLNNSGLDPKRFPEVILPHNLTVTSDSKEAFADSKAVIVAVPSQTMRRNIKQIRSYLNKSMLIISAAKGLEIGSGKRMSQVIVEEINPRFRSNLCVLSGPNLSREILHSLPAASVIAAEDVNVARKVQRLLSTPKFCVFTNTDIIGLELGGALKNIIALGAGIVDGLSYGDNAKAAFMTRGWTEMTALGVTLGANPLTFSGLAGLGDLIATCASPLSRNHYVGVELSKGHSLAEITKSMTEVAEGIDTTLVVRELAHQLGLEMPVTEKIYRVLFKNANPGQAAVELLEGSTRHELSGRKWQLFSLFKRRKHPSETKQ